jgi:hypothetical protein
VANRVMSPTSRAITTASVRPTPGSVKQALNRRRRLKHGLDPVLELVHLAVQTLHLAEQLPGKRTPCGPAGDRGAVIPTRASLQSADRLPLALPGC